MKSLDLSIDWAAIQDRFEGDIELFCEIARLFLDDCPKRLSVMRDALSCGDCRTLERVAHSLKGSVSNFAAADAMQAARELEDLARDGQLDRVSDACTRLETELSRLIAALDQADRVSGPDAQSLTH